MKEGVRGKRRGYIDGERMDALREKEGERKERKGKERGVGKTRK